MATKTFSGTLSQAMDSLAAEGNKIIFVPQQTVGDVLTGASSIMTVDSDGSYSVKLSYNTYSIYHYSDVSKRKIKIGDNIVVASDTTADTLSDLITSATGELTSDEVLAIQGYLEDAETYATAAASSYTDTAALFDDFDDNVLDVVGEIHTDTPALSIPFNESGRLDYGYGTEYVSGLPVYSVDYSRNYATTVINKSGETEDLSANEIAIGSDGVWLHGAYTNLCAYGDDLSSWIVDEDMTILTDTVGQGMAQSGTGGYVRYFASDIGAVSTGDPLTVSLLAKPGASSDLVIDTYYMVGGAGLTRVTFDLDELTYEVSSGKSDGVVGAEMEFVADGYIKIVLKLEVSDDTYQGFMIQLRSYYGSSGDGSTIDTYVKNVQIVYDCSSYLPYVPTSGDTEHAGRTSCEVPINNNLPVTGNSCTWVLDTNAPKSGESNRTLLSVSGASTSGDFVGILLSSASVLTFRAGSNGGGDAAFGGAANNSAYIDGGQNRFAFVYDADAETVTAYINGNPNAIGAMSVSGMTFPSDGVINLGESASTWHLNAQIKNFNIYHYAADAAEVASWGGAK